MNWVQKTCLQEKMIRLKVTMQIQGDGEISESEEHSDLK